MHANVLGFVISVTGFAVVIGGPVLLIHRVWKHLGRR